MRVWDAGVPITATGVISPAAQYCRVHLSTIPPWLSQSGEDPPRYRFLGRIGLAHDGYRDAGSILVYADQELDTTTPDPGALYYVLENGVGGTLYRGTEMPSELPIACEVRASGSQSIPNTTPTAITFDTEVSDPYGMHSPTTNPSRVTVPAPGVYLITGRVAYAQNATGFRAVDLVVNGGTYIAGNYLPVTTSGTAIAMLGVNAIHALNQGDYVELVALQGSGGALNSLANPDSAPSLSLVRVG